MTRISLKEQYDNKDVIQQIYSLKDRQEGLEDEVSKAVSDSSQALSAVEELAPTVARFDGRIAQAQADATLALTQAEEAQTDADSALSLTEIRTTAAEGTLWMKQVNNVEKVSNIPIADESKTGLMNAQTYQSLKSLNARVSALEASQTVAYVVLPSSTPTQEQITAAFSAVVGRSPVAGDLVKDIAKSLTYEYDGSTWIQTTAPVATWTNEGAGIIKGTPSTGPAGTLFAEEDGTGSVNGWDELNTKIANGFTLNSKAFSGYSFTEMADRIQVKFDALDGTTSISEEIPAATDEKAGCMSAADKTRLDGSQPRIATVEISLPSSGWDASTKSQAVVVSGMKANSIVWVSPTADSFLAYGKAQIRATAQGEGTLTFVCESVPATDLKANVGVA